MPTPSTDRRFFGLQYLGSFAVNAPDQNSKAEQIRKKLEALRIDQEYGRHMFQQFSDKLGFKRRKMNHENDNDLHCKVEQDLRQIRTLINRNSSSQAEDGTLSQLQLRHLATDTTSSDVNAELINFEKLFGLYSKLKDDANKKLRELKVMVKEGKEVYEKTGKLLDSLNRDKTNDSSERKSEILDGVTCYNIDNHLRSNETKMQRVIKSTEGVKSLQDSLMRYQKIYKLTRSELDLMESRYPMNPSSDCESKSKKSISFRRFVRDATNLNPLDNERDVKITKLMSEIDVFMDEKK